MSWHYLEIKEVFHELKSNKKGLSGFEVKKRREEYGLNELKEFRKKSSLKKFSEQFTSFLVLILIAAVVFSLAAQHWIDAIVISAIIMLNAFLGFFQEHKAEKAMAALKKLSAPTAIVIREDRRLRIDAEELVPGDIILLEAGDNIPADCRVIHSSQLKVDESSLTGESLPVSKNEKTVKIASNVSEMHNMLFMSTNVMYGSATAIVVSTGMKTELGKIASIIQEEEKLTPLQKRLEHFGKEIGIIVVALSALIALIEIIRGKAMIDMLIVGISIAVAAVPEGLPAVVTITLALGMQKLARKKAIVRKLPAVETLGSTTVICSDKTGTITKNEMTVTEIFSDNKLFSLDKFEKNFIDLKKNNSVSQVLKIGVLCNNAVIENKKLIGHPTEGALVYAAEKTGFETSKIRKEFEKIWELSFDSSRKMMTTIHLADSEAEAYVKGAPEILLKKCRFILKNGKIEKLTKEDILKIKKQEKEMASKALRVLAFAYKKVPVKKKYSFSVENDLIFAGLIGMIDPPRKEVKYAIGKCKTAGIKVMMLTGDYEITARAIAEQVGLIKKGEEVIIGSEIDEMTDAELSKAVESVNVFARISPEHKVRIVRILREKGEVVAVTGDGINDAPALKKADIGIAMGIAGTDVSKEASEMILADDNFSTIVNAIEGGRTIFQNIKKFIQYLLSCNSGEVLTMLTASLIGFAALPLVPVQILWLNLVTDGLPAIALGVDPAEKNVMKRKPDKNRRTVGKKAGIEIICIGILMCIVTLFVFYKELPDILTARTMAFTTIMMMQMAIVFNIKTEKSIFKGEKLFNNKLLICSVLISIILQLLVIYVPMMQIFFHTTALPLVKLAEVLAIALITFIGIEVVKIKYFVT